MTTRKLLWRGEWCGGGAWWGLWGWRWGDGAGPGEGDGVHPAPSGDPDPGYPFDISSIPPLG